jgi:hypothetical protein
MGAACVRAGGSDQDNAINHHRYRDEKNQHKVSNKPVLHSLATLCGSNHDSDSLCSSLSMSRINEPARAALHAFHGSLTSIGEGASRYLARYLRALPKKPLYLRHGHEDSSSGEGNGRMVSILSHRCKTQLAEAMEDCSITSSMSRLRAPTNSLELLKRY